MSSRRPGEREDGKKLYFPEGALLNQMEVAVVESERRKSDILKEPYVVYLVESRYVSRTRMALLAVCRSFNIEDHLGLYHNDN